MDLELITGIPAVLIIVGLIGAIKKVFNLDPKLSPVLAIIFGLAASIGATFYSETKIFEAIIIGIALGLSAVGLFSGAKNTIERYTQGK